MIVQFKTSAMKKYKAIFVRTEEKDITGENFFDAMKKANEEAERRGMKVGELVDVVKGEKIVYKPKIEMV